MSRPAGSSPQYVSEVLEALPAIVWTADPATLTFTRVSRGAELILGYPVSKWMEPHFWRDHIHPDDRHVLSIFQSPALLESDHEIVYRMIAADGRMVWIRDRIRPCVVDEGVPALCGVMLDISAERRAYEALARSEENHRRLVDTAPDAIGVHTRGRFVYVNPKFVETFGASHQSELVGREVLSLVDPAYREIVRGRQAQVAIGDAVPMTREKLIRIDGTPFDGEVMAIPVVFNGARAVQVVVRDVTESIRMNERMELLATSTNEAIWEGDLTTNEFWTNEVFRILFGAAPDFECAQRNWRENIHPGDRERMTTLLRDVDRWSEEYRIRTVAGQYIWVLDRGRRLTNHEGKPLRVIGALLDVTPLREAEQRFRQIVEQVQDIIFTLDREARITSVNPAFERITGWKMSDWIGRSIFDLLLPEYHDNAMDHFRHAVETPGEPPRQYKLRTAYGTIEVEGSGQPHVVNDTIVGVIGVARDVTEQNLLQRRLDDTRRIASLGSLAASIAHEFNNVLMTIESFTKAPAAHDAQRQIRDALERGKRVTGEILMYASPKEPEIETIDPVPWLRTLVSAFRAIVPAKISIALDARTTEKIRGDRLHLEQVLMNLVMNARDAMPDGGALTIELAADADQWRRRAALDPHTRYVRLSVCDNGIGIGADVLPSIFEPLFTTKRGGTGLGLAIAKRLVESQNGAIAVESTAGIGTAFHLFLPASV